VTVPDDGDDVVVVRGVALRRDPARESCFVVVHDQNDMIRINDESDASQREKLHVELNAELQSLEIAAQSLVDFPEAEWDVRLSLARQCWDECRHAWLCHRRLVDKGGRKGEFPVINQEWGLVCMYGSLLARLAVQNRTFEAGSLDVFQRMVVWWRDRGDEETAADMEAIQADEIAHVRFANDWIGRATAGNPKATLEVGAALASVKQRLVRLQTRLPSDPERRVDPVVPANVDDRRQAGFSERAISELADRAAHNG
jgi:uncharacterized ferritin-like protein (DUF455 family)